MHPISYVALCFLALAICAPAALASRSFGVQMFATLAFTAVLLSPTHLGLA